MKRYAYFKDIQIEIFFVLKSNLIQRSKMTINRTKNVNQFKLNNKNQQAPNLSISSTKLNNKIEKNIVCSTIDLVDVLAVNSVLIHTIQRE